MWKKINSPIVITAIVIVSLFIFSVSMKGRLASEIRNAYEELNEIIEDSASDAEKTKAIQEFTQEIGTQIRAGFSAGFESNKKKPTETFLETKKNIEIKNIKYVESEWEGHESLIYTIENNSDQNIGSLRLNIEYYRDGKLIDCKSKWVNEIKILEPEREVAIKTNRKIPKKDTKEEQEKFKSDKVKIIVTSFDIK